MIGVRHVCSLDVGLVLIALVTVVFHILLTAVGCLVLAKLDHVFVQPVHLPVVSVAPPIPATDLILPFLVMPPLVQVVFQELVIILLMTPVAAVLPVKPVPAVLVFLPVLMSAVHQELNNALVPPPIKPAVIMMPIPVWNGALLYLVRLVKLVPGQVSVVHRVVMNVALQGQSNALTIILSKLAAIMMSIPVWSGVRLSIVRVAYTVLRPPALAWLTQ